MCQIKNERIPFIVYYAGTGTLIIQVSIPKFLYGDNVTLIKESDIDRFYIELHQHLKFLLKIDIQKEEWIIADRGIDVCWNFQVGSRIDEYMRVLSVKSFPFKKTIVYGHGETIEYKNKSSQIIFYKKEPQCIKDKQSLDVIEKAKGIIRLEIRPSKNDRSKYTKSRRLVDLLTKEFFKCITANVLNQISITNTVIEDLLDTELLKKHQLSQLETLLGFMKLRDTLGETSLKKFYKQSTFQNRKKLVKQIQFPSFQLGELSINYNEIN
nr:hypothetical protein [Brevibacillus laterosporus]